jgi:hypothetical protein
MSPNFVRYKRIFLVLSVIPLLIAFLTVLRPALNLRSQFVMIDPSPDQRILTPPFDIVLDHEGCGTIEDPTTFQAYLSNENGERVKADFVLDTNYSAVQRWVLANYDPKTQFKQGSYGRFSLDVTAEESGFCFIYLRMFSFKVAEFIGPQLFAPVPGQGPAISSPPYHGSVAFQSALHDKDDKDEFTIKATGAPNGTFGSWFNITVSSVNPNDPKHYFELLSPKDLNHNPAADPDGLIENPSLSSSSTLWIGLKNGVSTKFRISQEKNIPGNRSLMSYKVEITQTSIPDLNEPNETLDTATYLRKDASIQGYMVNVLDANGEQVGLNDWYKIDHRYCVNDCFFVHLPAGDTRPYFITAMCDLSDATSREKAEVSDCPDGDNKCIKVCSFDSTQCLISDPYKGNYGKGNGTRYWNIDADTKDHISDPFGVSDKPQHYDEKYTVTWFEKSQCTLDNVDPPIGPNCTTPCLDISPSKP